MNKKLIALILLVVLGFVSIFYFSTLVKSSNDIELTGTVATLSGSLNVRKSPTTSSTTTTKTTPNTNRDNNINIAIKHTGIETETTKHSMPVSYANREYKATVSSSFGIDFSFTNTLNKPIVLELVGGNGSCICNVYEVN